LQIVGVRESELFVTGNRFRRRRKWRHNFKNSTKLNWSLKKLFEN